MINKLKNLFKDTIIFSIGSIGSKLILFIMVPIYTNYLTAEEYGISELVFTMAQLIIPFFSLVIFDAVLRFGISKNYQPQNVLLSGMIVVLFGSIILILLTPVIGLYQPLQQWKWYLSAYVIFNMFSCVETNYLKATGRNKLYAVIHLVQTFILALFNILLITVYHFGIKGYLISIVLSNISSTLIAFFWGNIANALKRSRFDCLLFKQMISFSIPLILNNLSWWVIQSSNKIMVEIIIGSAALGIYTISTKIPSLINVIISIFSQAWNISSAKEIENDQDSEFYTNVFNFYFSITFIFTIILIGIIKPFMSIYVGKEFSDAYRYIPALLTSAAFSSVSSYFVSIYAALKKSLNNMLSTLITAVINILLNFLLIKSIGLWGAAIATLTAYIILSTIRMLDIKRFIKIKINYTHYLISSILLLGQTIAVSANFHIYTISSVVLILYCSITIPLIKKNIKNIKK